MGLSKYEGKYEHFDSYGLKPDKELCGSHVVHRLYRLKKQKMDLNAYHNFMQSLKEDYNMSFDMIVAEFIKPFLST